jgi:hypothetical protein
VLPPLLLSIVRKPVDFFTINPWLRRLPEYLASSEHTISTKAEKLSNLALFWFSADSPYGGTEWGFAVDGAMQRRRLRSAGAARRRAGVDRDE